MQDKSIMPTTPYIDFHTHQVGRAAAERYNSTSHDAPILAIQSIDLANPSDLADLHQIEAQAQKAHHSPTTPTPLITIGWHPMGWSLEQIRQWQPTSHTPPIPTTGGLTPILIETLKELSITPTHFSHFSHYVSQRLTTLATTHRKHLFGIGECGWDRRSELPLPLQDHLFAIHLHVATQIEKPLVLHIVRAYDHLLQYRKQYLATAHHPIPWIVHGFRGKQPLIQQLEQMGCILSLHPQHVLHGGALPQHYLLETDTSSIPLPSIYQSLAPRAGIPRERLRTQVYTFFNHLTTVFGNK